jgi:hypothetical protein
MYDSRDKREGEFKYKARNGRYYNGYAESPDFSEDHYNSPTWQKMLKDIERDLMDGTFNKRLEELNKKKP